MPFDIVKQVERFKEFIEQTYEKKLYELVQKGVKSLIVDFSELAKFDYELAELLLQEPEELLKAFEIALDQIELEGKTLKRIRVYKLPESQKVQIKDIRSLHIDKFMVIEGIVRQASEVRPQVTSAKFECPSCGNTITILQIESKFKEPMRCSCGRRGHFRLISKDLVDAQRLVIEETPEALEGGEQPKRLSVFLKEDLVEPKMEKKTTPGSKVRVVGVIRDVPIISKLGGQSTRYDLMMDSNYIEPIDEIYEEIELSVEDKEKIMALPKDPKIYEELTNSIAPSIYGHKEIKNALIFQLLGGIRKMKDDGTKIRGDMHVLLVGDPGSGKSATLQFIANAAPKGRFISGKGASGAGITASVVKDEFLRGWALEAGAMVLANKGIAVIDELDKMTPEDRSALHEAMEQQTITISKANIQATLRAETTVLAAANPKLGRFDPYQPIASQIDLPPTLINRFDLIFPVRDLPNRELDEKIASHILESQQKPKETVFEIELKLLKKYISYARQKVFPTLTRGAVDEIKKFYVELRNSGTTGDEAIKPIPVSARQLEALVRLSEASARARLSDKVIKDDAKRAIDLLKYCLMQVGYDYETGKIDIDRISTGISAAARSKILVVREIINDFEAKGIKPIPIEEVVSEAIAKGVEESQVEEIIEKLKRGGDIFEPRRGFIQRV